MARIATPPTRIDSSIDSSHNGSDNITDISVLSSCRYLYVEGPVPIAIKLVQYPLIIEIVWHYMGNIWYLA